MTDVREWTTAENLQVGDCINVGDQTEEEFYVTVDSVTLAPLTVLIGTKELAFPFVIQYGEQVTFE